MNTRKPKTRIVIADDHAVVRAGLRLLLESQEDMEVAGEAGDATEALAQVRALKPDVVLLDITMGAGGGLKAPEEIAKAAPGTKVLILSMHSDPAFVRTAMLAGAAGYVSKKTAHTELLKALRTIRAGKRYVDSAVSEGLLPETARKGAVLSQREEQVLLLIASGHSYQEIADRISVSVKTVETYRARIMENWNSKAAQSSCSTPLTQVCWDAISREPSPRACWNENFIFVQDHQAGTCVDGVSLATLRGKVGKTPDKQPLLFGTSLTI